MNIVIFGLKKSPYKASIGSFEYKYVYLGQNLIKNGHQATLVFESQKNYLPKNYLHINLQQFAKIDFLAVLKIIFSKQKIDILHITSLEFAWILFWFKIFRPNTKLILEANHSSFQKWDFDSKFDIIHCASTASKLADKIVVSNSILQKYFIDNLSTDAQIVEYTGIFSLSHTSRILQKYNLKNRNYLYVHSLTNSGNKQLKLLLISYLKLNINTPLVISGEVNLSLKSQYKSDHIIWMGDLKNSELYTLASKAKIFFNFHPLEENKTLLLQAICNATPVILLHHPLLKNIASRNAMYVYPDNLSSLKTILDFTLQNYILTTHIAQRLKAKTQNIYTFENYYKKLLYLYVNTLAKAQAKYPVLVHNTIKVPFKN